jgi:hypothetical protein
MRDKQTVKIKIKPHLKAFILAVYGQEQALEFPTRDRLKDLLQLLLSKAPSNYKLPDPNEVLLEVVIPEFEVKAMKSYIYLSPANQKDFTRRINMIFWVTFEEFIDECFRRDLGRNDAISLFVEKYNLQAEIHIRSSLKKHLYLSKRILRKYPKRAYSRKHNPTEQEG